MKKKIIGIGNGNGKGMFQRKGMGGGENVGFSKRERGRENVGLDSGLKNRGIGKGIGNKGNEEKWEKRFGVMEKRINGIGNGNGMFLGGREKGKKNVCLNRAVVIAQDFLKRNSPFFFLHPSFPDSDCPLFIYFPPLLSLLSFPPPSPLF